MSPPSASAFGAEPALLDRLLEGCQILDFDWRYLYLNDVAVTQARRTRAELLGRTLHECYPGVEQAPMYAVLERCLRERIPGHIEAEFAFPDGTRPTFELRMVPVPAGVCVLSRDVTERRHQLAQLVHSSIDAIVSTTLDGLVTSWNPSAERIFGYTEQEMLGRPVNVIFPHGRRDDRDALEIIARGELPPTVEENRIRKDGSTVEVSVAVSPLRNFAGEVVGLSKVARDISALRAAQRDVERSRDALAVANRELEAFSYSVAHDLRTPLRGIDGFSQALLEDYGARLDDEGRRLLHIVRDSAQHMERLIDDFLALARVTRSEIARAHVDVSALAADIVRRLRAAEPGRRVEVSIAPGMALHGDPRLLEIVFDNLLANAWKFTSRRALAHIEVAAFRDPRGETVCVVRDDGAGFQPEYAHKLFGVFQRLHSSHEFAGNGIGLATVERVVRRHGGRVWAEGAPDAGAAFYFTLGEEGTSS